MTQSVNWDLENDAVRRELDITRDELRRKEDALANASRGMELFAAENERLKSALSLAVEALKECEVAYNNVFAEMQKNFPRITSIGEFDYLKRAADRARSAYESLTRKG